MEDFFKRVYAKLGGKRNSFLAKLNRNIKNQKGKVVNKHKLKKKGVEVLNTFFEACHDANVPCWLEFGTLLGAYREKSFIKNDDDLDCGMFAEDYTIDFINILMEYGFKLIKAFYCEDLKAHNKILTEVAIEYKGMKLDVFLSYKCPNNKRKVRSLFMQENREFNVNEYMFENPVLPLPEVEIEGTKYSSPGIPDCYLKIAYGPSFMVPDPNWKGPTDKMLPPEQWKGIGMFYDYKHKYLLPV